MGKLDLTSLKNLKLGGAGGLKLGKGGGSKGAAASNAPIPKRLQAKIGLDIGSRYIKLVHMSASSQGLHLVNFGISATPMGSVNEGVINNPEAIGEAISQILKFYNIKEKRVVTSLPGRAVVIRQVTIPAGLQDKEIKQGIISDVERFLPFPLDEMEFTYHKLGDIMTGDVRQSSVLFIAAHKDSVTRRVEAIRFAGLESVEMDVEPFVILRSVVETGLFDDADTFNQTLLLLDMGASSTNVSIIHAGSLRFTRIFAIGGDTFTHALESGMDLSYLEAEKVKMEKAVAILDDDSMTLDQESRDIYELIQPHLETLAVEIRRSLAYYTSKYRGESVTKIVLTGGASRMKGINRFFEADLGIPVMHSHPMANISYVSDGDVAKLQSIVPFLGIAIGLGLRQLNPRLLGHYIAPVRVEADYVFGSTTQTGGVGA